MVSSRDDDDEEEDDKSPTTSQTTDVFPVPLDPMQKMGAGTYTDAAEEGTILDDTEAVKEAVDERIECNFAIWTSLWGYLSLRIWIPDAELW